MQSRPSHVATSFVAPVMTPLERMHRQGLFASISANLLTVTSQNKGRTNTFINQNDNGRSQRGLARWLCARYAPISRLHDVGPTIPRFSALEIRLPLTRSFRALFHAAAFCADEFRSGGHPHSVSKRHRAHDFRSAVLRDRRRDRAHGRLDSRPGRQKGRCNRKGSQGRRLLARWNLRGDAATMGNLHGTRER